MYLFRLIRLLWGRSAFLVFLICMSIIRCGLLSLLNLVSVFVFLQGLQEQIKKKVLSQFLQNLYATLEKSHMGMLSHF